MRMGEGYSIVCVCVCVCVEVAGGIVVKALGSHPSGCGFKPHQVQGYFHHRKKKHQTCTSHLQHTQLLSGDLASGWGWTRPLPVPQPTHGPGGTSQVPTPLVVAQAVLLRVPCPNSRSLPNAGHLIPLSGVTKQFAAPDPFVHF